MRASGLWTTARTQSAREIAIPQNKHAHPPHAHTHITNIYAAGIKKNVKKKQDQHAAPLRNGDGDGDDDDDDADDDDGDEEEELCAWHKRRKHDNDDDADDDDADDDGEEADDAGDDGEEADDDDDDIWP